MFCAEETPHASALRHESRYEVEMPIFRQVMQLDKRTISLHGLAQSGVMSLRWAPPHLLKAERVTGPGRSCTLLTAQVSLYANLGGRGTSVAIEGNYRDGLTSRDFFHVGLVSF